MKKNLSYLLILLCFVVITILIIFYRTLPKKSGKLELSILSEKVTVYKDEFGIPHIDADDHLDGYKALGFTVASDRLFQMELFRRMINGTLSEVLGDKTLEADKLLRTLQFKKTAEKNYIAYKSKFPELVDELEAFVSGANYFIQNQPLPIEFLLLNYKPKLFTVQDVMGLPHFMALRFAEGIIGDVLNHELSLKLPLEKINLLRRGVRGDQKYYFDKEKPEANDKEVVKTRSDNGPLGGMSKNGFLSHLFKSADQISGLLPLFQGSNMWMISGEKSKSGYPILANDPHIGVSNPHIFYEAHLKTPKLEIYGEFIPFMPFATLGQTRKSAWGFTMSEVDDLNVYEEKINPENPEQVMFKGEWVPLKKWSEAIKVKGQKDVIIDIAVTPHGPLIDDKYSMKERSLSLSWSIYHPENFAINTLRALNYADSVEEFRDAVSYGAAPGLNIGWVHKRGDIGWWMFGKNPKLPEGVSSDIVLNGWNGKNEIERYYTIDENPHSINPKDGIIISANYKPMEKEFDHFEGYWQPGGRFFRLESLLKKRNDWSKESLKEIQTDNRLPFFDIILEKYKESIVFEQLDSFEREALEHLFAWDGETTKNSLGASIYYMTNYFVGINVFDELSEKERLRLAKIAHYTHLLKELLFNPSHSFWDNIKTNKVEVRADIITSSFKEAVDELKNRLGRNIITWEWGRMHYSEYIHPLGRVKPLNLIYNFKNNGSHGGRNIINNMAFKRGTSDFRVIHAPSTRRLIDMSNVEDSLNVIPTGNSGNPFSPHYSDQMKIYQNLDYRKQIMNWEDIKKKDRLILTP